MRKRISPSVYIMPSQNHPHCGKTTQVRNLRKSLQPEFNPQHSYENPHGVQTIHLRVLRKRFPPKGKLQKPPTDPFGWEGIQVQHLQQSFSPGKWGRLFFLVITNNVTCWKIIAPFPLDLEQLLSSISSMLSFDERFCKSITPTILIYNTYGKNTFLKNKCSNDIDKSRGEEILKFHDGFLSYQPTGTVNPAWQVKLA